MVYIEGPFWNHGVLTMHFHISKICNKSIKCISSDTYFQSCKATASLCLCFSVTVIGATEELEEKKSMGKSMASLSEIVVLFVNCMNY